MEGVCRAWCMLSTTTRPSGRAIERRLKHAGYEVATYASAQHLLDRLPSESVPSCILLDVQIPGLDGPALQSRLSELGSTLPIIFLTGHPDIPTTVRAIKAGADDFLTKPVSSDELLQAIERAIADHEVTFGLKNKLNMVRARIATLTPRERQVFELVIRGDTNKQIARALGCDRTHDQGPSPKGDGENASPHLGGTGLPCRAGRRWGLRPLLYRQHCPLALFIRTCCRPLSL